MQKTNLPWDITKFDNHHQIGGIQLARVAPAFGGDIHDGSRVAMVNTGSGLRLTVALDRGGDIIDASFNQHSLTYLTPVGLKPPSHAYHRGFDWLFNWPAGLVTTCGPHAIGAPHEEGGIDYNLHGHYSNTPAKLDMLLNPDPHHGTREMLISMTTRTSRMFGPVFEIKRQIQAALGESQFIMYDQVTNRGDEPAAHHWLYHVNVGYPLLDAGAKFIYRGRVTGCWQAPQAGKPPTEVQLNRMKTATDGLKEHAGTGERGMFVDIEPDRQGDAHVGIINRKLGLGLELTFPVETLPRIANWQHYGPRGSYVAGIEPVNGAFGGGKAATTLEPGESIRYRITFTVHHTREALSAFAKHDGPIKR
jgi:hypothetical protein